MNNLLSRLRELRDELTRSLMADFADDLDAIIRDAEREYTPPQGEPPEAATQEAYMSGYKAGLEDGKELEKPQEPRPVLSGLAEALRRKAEGEKEPSPTHHTLQRISDKLHKIAETLPEEAEREIGLLANELWVMTLGEPSPKQREHSTGIAFEDTFEGGIELEGPSQPSTELGDWGRPASPTQREALEAWARIKRCPGQDLTPWPKDIEMLEALIEQAQLVDEDTMKLYDRWQEKHDGDYNCPEWQAFALAQRVHSQRIEIARLHRKIEQARPIPDGWKLAPMRPTTEMLEAVNHGDMDDWDMYCAMLSAAPQPGDGE